MLPVTSVEIELTPSSSNLWTIFCAMLVLTYAGMLTDSFLHSPVPLPSIER